MTNFPASKLFNVRYFEQSKLHGERDVPTCTRALAALASNCQLDRWINGSEDVEVRRHVYR